MSLWRKDPSAVLDFRVDWEPWLEGDTITGSTWLPATGIVVDSAAFTTTSATVWLSGGTAGTVYTLTNRVTTAGGRTDDRSITILVGER